MSRKSIEQEEEQQAKEEKEKERKKDHQGESLNQPGSIFPNMVFRSQSKQSLEDHAGKRDAPLPLSLPFLCSNEKIRSFARSVGRLVTSLTCIFSAREKGQFPARQRSCGQVQFVK